MAWPPAVRVPAEAGPLFSDLRGDPFRFLDMRREEENRVTGRRNFFPESVRGPQSPLWAPRNVWRGNGLQCLSAGFAAVQVFRGPLTGSGFLSLAR